MAIYKDGQSVTYVRSATLTEGGDMSTLRRGGVRMLQMTPFIIECVTLQHQHIYPAARLSQYSLKNPILKYNAYNTAISKNFQFGSIVCEENKSSTRMEYPT